MVDVRKGEDGKAVRRRAVAKAILSLAKLGLTFVHIKGDSSATVGGRRVEMPAIFHQALLLAPAAGLRTFDLVHLAAAKYSRLQGNELGSFVTGDRDFLRNRKELSRIIGFPILTPIEYLECFRLLPVQKRVGQAQQKPLGRDPD